MCRAHLRCGDDAPNDCGLRPPRHQASASNSPPVPMSPVKGNKKIASLAPNSVPNFPSSAPKA